jgi:hypothetical protein
LLTLPSLHVAAMFFIPLGKCGFSPLKLGETLQEIKGEMPHLKNSKSVWKRRVYAL